jgi:hypothetical protein
MRTALFALALGLAGTALLPSHQAKAWYDRWGVWHPNYYRPPVVVVPPAVYPRPYAYAYPRPYGRWIPPHRDYYGRFIPGHWG